MSTDVRSRYLYWSEEIKLRETAKGIQEVYDDWSENYDESATSPLNVLPGRKMMTDTITKFITNEEVRIMDFTSGTGIMGEMLFKIGYNNIDGLDGSPKSIEIAHKKEVYKNLTVEWIEESHKLTIDDDTYDVLLCYGGFALNHLNVSVLSEWDRIVKPGGYVFMAYRQYWIDLDPKTNDGQFDRALQKLADKGKWKLIERVIQKDENDKDKNITHVVFQVMNIQ